MNQVSQVKKYRNRSKYAGTRKRIFLFQTISRIRNQVRRAGESLYTFNKIYDSIPPYWRLSKWARHQLTKEIVAFVLKREILRIWYRTNGNIIYQIDPQIAMSEKIENLMADLMGGTCRD